MVDRQVRWELGVLLIHSKGIVGFKSDVDAPHRKDGMSRFALVLVLEGLQMVWPEDDAQVQCACSGTLGDVNRSLDKGFMSNHTIVDGHLSADFCIQTSPVSCK